VHSSCWKDLATLCNVIVCEYILMMDVNFDLGCIQIMAHVCKFCLFESLQWYSGSSVDKKCLNLFIAIYFYGATLYWRGICYCLVSVCLSQVGVLLKRLSGLSWFFVMEASCHLSYTVLWGNLGNSKKEGYFPQRLCPELLEYFASAASRCRDAVNKSV